MTLSENNPYHIHMDDLIDAELTIAEARSALHQLTRGMHDVNPYTEETLEWQEEVVSLVQDMLDKAEFDRTYSDLPPSSALEADIDDIIRGAM